MKKYNILQKSTLLILIPLFLLVSFRVLNAQKENNELVGIWISTDDTNWVWDFRSDGKLYSYYEGKLSNTYSYSVETTSPQCGKVVDVGANFSYLKLIDLSDQNAQCYEFYGFSDEYIQLKRFDYSGFMNFKKSTNTLEEPDDDFDYGDGDQQFLP